MSNVNPLNWEVHLKVAKVIEVYVGHPLIAEDKRAYCDLEVSDGTKKTLVPFSSGTFDVSAGTTNGMPHGIFIAPIVGQMVGVMFVHGSYLDPVAAFPIPFDSDGGNNTNLFDLTKVWPIVTNPDDIYICHRSGAKMILSHDGKAYINDLEIDP